VTRAICALAAVLAACTATHPVLPPPTGVVSVAIAPVENKTGSTLAIAGDTYVGRLIGRQRRSVPDALARELETALRDRGFAVGGADGPRLRIVLQRFEPDQPQLAYVSVALTASLVDPDGTVRWSGERSKWLVSTAGAVSLEDAYDAAARTVARGVVDGWQPAH
jgi:hypothetical protein